MTALDPVGRLAFFDDEHRSVRYLLDEHLVADVGRVAHELLLSVDESLQGAEDLLRGRPRAPPSWRDAGAAERE